jgi:hypothetical protein
VWKGAGSCGLSKAEHPPLFGPAGRQCSNAQQAAGLQSWRLPPFENGADDVGREEAEAREAKQLRLLDLAWFVARRITKETQPAA